MRSAFQGRPLEGNWPTIGEPRKNLAENPKVGGIFRNLSRKKKH